MTELSPQAQAVWDAYELVDCDPYEIDPRKAGLSAALEAAADQVVPDQQEPATSPHMGNFISHTQWLQCQGIRHQLLAIAAELRGTTPTETP